MKTLTTLLLTLGLCGLSLPAFAGPSCDVLMGDVEGQVPEGDGVLNVLDVVAIDAGAQVITGQRIEITADGNRLLPYMLRYATPGQLDAMAAEVSLLLVDRRQDWSGTPFTDGSGTHVSTWRPAP